MTDLVKKMDGLPKDHWMHVKKHSVCDIGDDMSSPRRFARRPDVASGLVKISHKLGRDVDHMRFRLPVTHVYNPLRYAAASHEQYLRRYGARTGRVILLGMNPGPFGMAQTGVPFGDVTFVRDWLGICVPVKKPRLEHPQRPVLGFGCSRSEVSGARLWSWARRRFGTPERFFRRFLILNYCPLVFMDKSGRNRTPDKLATREREVLFRACDRALREEVVLLKPSRVIGIGVFAERRAREALDELGIAVDGMLHPSPANPRANRDWQGIIEGQLGAMGIRIDRAAPDIVMQTETS